MITLSLLFQSATRLFPVLFLMVVMAACAKNVDSLPEAGPNYQNSANEESGFAQDETRLAAEQLFGQHAERVGMVLEDLFKKYGRPTAYITGTEVSGAMVIGGRWGDGTLHHKLEGKKPIAWFGPSVGFDFGANGGEMFTLVYNLYDPEKIYQWVPGGDGQAYFMGGFNITYQEDQGIRLVTIKLGVGLRLGVNIGVNKFYHPNDVPDEAPRTGGPLPINDGPEPPMDPNGAVAE